jgi:probable HAF family extracellular repeat protein
MKLRSIVSATGLACLVGLSGPAHAAVTFQYLFSGGFPTAMTDDGTVVAGNTVGEYQAFRWTQATGLVPLGRSALAMVGTTGGVPGMSADGMRVASTIGSEDSTVSTAGLWTQADGWVQLAPPLPPGGGAVDRSIADVGGMSADGNTVIGLFWRPGGRAHGYRWTQATGMVDLGSTGLASKAIAVNQDGSVIAGWDEAPTNSLRHACVWRDGVQTILTTPAGTGEALAVSPDGNWVGGRETNLVTGFVDAAMWHWNGSAWSPTQYLGHVDGNSGFAYGKTLVKSMTADAKFAVGYNSFDGDPFYTTGFLWTDTTGVIDVEFWLADKGVVVDPLFDIQSLDLCSKNGEILIGSGADIVAPYTKRTFMIHTGRGLLAVEPVAAKPGVQLAASPNPARGGTSFAFTLGAAGHARLGVYDASGRLVRTVQDGELAAGTHRLAWDGRDADGQAVRAGVYFMRLESAGESAGGKLVVLQ